MKSYRTIIVTSFISTITFLFLSDILTEVLELKSQLYSRGIVAIVVIVVLLGYHFASSRRKKH